MTEEEFDYHGGIADERAIVRAATDDPVRREVLRYLRNADSVMLGKLARELAESDAERRGVYATIGDYERLHEALHRVHLPSLAALGVIEYPRHLEWVRRRDVPPSVYDHLDNEESGSVIEAVRIAPSGG